MPLSRSEREEFLAEPHVGAVSVAAGPDRGPLIVPVWYFYEPGGDVWFLCDADSRKARQIAETGRFSLLAERSSPTMRYVAVEGPVIETRAPNRAEIAAMNRRYTGRPAQGEVTDPDAPDSGVLIRMRPTRWNSADLGAV